MSQRWPHLLTHAPQQTASFGPRTDAAAQYVTRLSRRRSRPAQVALTPSATFLAFRRGANDDQQALRGVLEPGLDMDAVGPEVHVTLGGQVALAPAGMLLRPGLLEPGNCASSYEWLEAQPDDSLDWVYLDSTHSYNGTKLELKLLNRKLKETGLICGDDWQSDRNARHHGVFLAINELIKAEGFEFVVCGIKFQWITRRNLKDTSELPFLREDIIYNWGS
jgi:hypothetical protein